MKDSLYIPEPFVERDAYRLAAFLENHPFGTLISVDEGAPIISHVPLLFERGAGTHGRLTGHLARANPHWQLLAKGEMVLTLFQGPHAYVSPAWYATPGGVPTWNYAVVHVQGVPRLVEDPRQCAEILRRMTAAYESRFPFPGSLAVRRVGRKVRPPAGYDRGPGDRNHRDPGQIQAQPEPYARGSPAGHWKAS